MKVKLLFAGLLAASTFLSSCSKDDDKNPANETGTLTATIDPVAGATRINVIMGTDTVKSTPSEGKFTVENLKAGNHTVLFTPAATYEQPTAQEVTITAGKTTDLGTIKISKMAPASMSAKIGGSSWSSVSPSTVSMNNTLMINGTGMFQSISLAISNLNGAKTYTGSEVTATVLNNSNFDSWMTGLSGSSVTVTVTKYDTENKKISGTFNFTAVASPGNSSTSNKVVTDGKFTNLTIK